MPKETSVKAQRPPRPWQADALRGASSASSPHRADSIPPSCHHSTLSTWPIAAEQPPLALTSHPLLRRARCDGRASRITVKLEQKKGPHFPSINDMLVRPASVWPASEFPIISSHTSAHIHVILPGSSNIGTSFIHRQLCSHQSRLSSSGFCPVVFTRAKRPSASKIELQWKPIGAEP